MHNLKNYLSYYITITERQRRVTVKDDSNIEPKKDDEELWLLKDVVFIEDVRSIPIGICITLLQLYL